MELQTLLTVESAAKTFLFLIKFFIFIILAFCTNNEDRHGQNGSKTTGKLEIFLTFFYVCGSFCPPGSGSTGLN
jgi:hypothetical protein